MDLSIYKGLERLGFQIKDFDRVIQGSLFKGENGFTVFVDTKEKNLTLTYSVTHAQRSLLYKQRFKDGSDALNLIQGNLIFSMYNSGEVETTDPMLLQVAGSTL